jgi:hypothetical protein
MAQSEALDSTHVQPDDRDPARQVPQDLKNINMDINTLARHAYHCEHLD